MGEPQNMKNSLLSKHDAVAESRRGSPTTAMNTDRLRKWFSWLGFQRMYNVPLFIVFAGALIGFVLARLQFLNVAVQFKKHSLPGEWYWIERYYSYRVGLELHLWACLPAGLLVVWQFVPVVRHKAPMFHRINGYAIMVLVIISNIGALMIARHAFGGDVSTQAAVGLLAILTTTGVSLGWWNIRKKQVDQHRAWFLRTAFYLGVIITTRIIMFISSKITTMMGSYWVVMSCGEILSMKNMTYIAEKYPACMLNSTFDPEQVTTVHAVYHTSKEEISASLRLGFGMATWVAIFMHAIGIEIYLALTPREAQRLRVVAYEKQIEAGYLKPGYAGLVPDKFGDFEEWKPSKSS